MNLDLFAVQGVTFISDIELSKVLSMDLKTLRNEIGLMNATIEGGYHIVSKTVVQCTKPIRVNYTRRFWIFQWTVHRTLDAGTYTLAYSDLFWLGRHMRESFSLQPIICGMEEATFAKRLSEVMQALISAYQPSEEDKLYTEKMLSEVQSHGFIPGTLFAEFLGVDHMLFHDGLYKFFTGQQDPPTMYKYNYDTLRYVINEDPYLNPLAAVGNFSNPTYGIRPEDIEKLIDIFPLQGERIGYIKSRII